MVNYNNGKIYKIEDLSGEICYIGSTTKERLCQRMVNHRAKYIHWKSGKTNKVMAYDISISMESITVEFFTTYEREGTPANDIQLYESTLKSLKQQGFGHSKFGLKDKHYHHCPL